MPLSIPLIINSQYFSVSEGQLQTSRRSFGVHLQEYWEYKSTNDLNCKLLFFYPIYLTVGRGRLRSYKKLSSSVLTLLISLDLVLKLSYSSFPN